MLTGFKDKISFVLKPLARHAYSIGFTSNAVTVIGFGAAVAAALCYGFGVSLLLASGLYFLAGFFDVLDGVIASSFSEATVFGGFLDSLLDRYSDAAVIVGIVLGGFCSLGWGMAALVGALLVSYARARGEAAKIAMASVGLAERAERIIIVVAASLLTLVYAGALSLGIVLLAIVSHVTVLQRAYHVWKNTKTR